MESRHIVPYHNASVYIKNRTIDIYSVSWEILKIRTKVQSNKNKHSFCTFSASWHLSSKGHEAEKLQKECCFYCITTSRWRTQVNHLNVKWHSDPWPVTVTSQPIRLSTNFMTLIPSLTFTYEWFLWSICNGCGMPAGNAYPSGHLVPSPFLGLAYAPVVETMSYRTCCVFTRLFNLPLSTFSTLLKSTIDNINCVFY